MCHTGLDVYALGVRINKSLVLWENDTVWHSDEEEFNDKSHLFCSDYC